MKHNKNCTNQYNHHLKAHRWQLDDQGQKVTSVLKCDWCGASFFLDLQGKVIGADLLRIPLQNTIDSYSTYGL